MRAGTGYVGGIDVKVCLTFTAIVNGMSQDEFDGATGVGITEVMQWSMSNIVLPGEAFAVGTAALFSDAGTLLDDRRRQVIGMGDTCGGIRHISTGTEHG